MNLGGILRRGGRIMVGGTALIQHLAVTRPSFVTKLSSSPAATTSTACYTSARAGTSMLKASFQRTAIQRYPSFFSGDLSPMVSMEGFAVPGGFGKFLRGVRMMGGGPRTFPGGVSKWQWKRMQLKKARQIEKARLLRERQAFEERRRKELLAASPLIEKPWDRPLRGPLPPPSAALDPQVRALADRFRRYDGMDLWTDEDGPEVATGLPTLVTARLRPAPTTSALFNSGGPMFDNRTGGRSQLRGYSPNSSAERADRMRNIPRTAVANPDRNVESIGERPYSHRAMAGGITSPRGASTGLLGKLDTLSIARNFSSSSGAVYLDDVDDERASSKSRRGVLRVGNDERSSQGRVTHSGSGKRVVDKSQPTVMASTAQEAEQQWKKLRPTPTDDTNGTATPTHLSETRFDQFPISRVSIRALHEVMGYERMTKVQEATFPVILEGKDVLAKAKTGTGKTIAFLLPSIEAILKASMERRSGAVSRSPIYVLIVCPTRELASQAATEAKTLMTYHKSMDAQIVMGGTNMNTEANNLKRNPCQILVATPGRLLDHMSSPDIQQQLRQLKVLVLDEADRLLDMGFRKDLEKIIKMLPASRQTLLFSATVPNEVHKVSEVALRKGHVFIDTVGKDTEDTHAKVQQQYVIVPLEKQMGLIYTLLENHVREEKEHKVLVFCTTARLTALMAEFSTKLGFNTLEIHSRKSQGFRTRVSDTFRNSVGVIMFTSDVSARGVDYPDVTLVLQLGIPAGREEYVHRLGRTGRAGKEGQGVLILAPWEQQFLKALKDIPIMEHATLNVAPGSEAKVAAALDAVSADAKEKAYAAWLGYYNSAKMLALNKTELVRLANFFSSTLGLREPPLLMKKTIGMMGLRGVPGLRSA